jgi:hypothetical protein
MVGRRRPVRPPAARYARAPGPALILRRLGGEALSGLPRRNSLLAGLKLLISLSNLRIACSIRCRYGLCRSSTASGRANPLSPTSFSQALRCRWRIPS